MKRVIELLIESLHGGLESEGIFFLNQKDAKELVKSLNKLTEDEINKKTKDLIESEFKYESFNW